MRLKTGETTLVVQERVIEMRTYGTPMTASVSWVANLEGYEQKTDAFVSMSREGKSPGEALSKLLAAMAEAGIRV